MANQFRLFGVAMPSFQEIEKSFNDYKSTGKFVPASSDVSYQGQLHSTLNTLNTLSPVVSSLRSSTSSTKYEDAVNKGLSSDAVQNFINQWQTSAAKVAQDYARTANEYNAQQAELAFQRAQSSAEKQMQFQREMFDKETAYNTLMSNTQYQRAVADLKKAGINPILAVGGLSGSVPSASSYSGASASASAPTAYNSDVVSGMNVDRSPLGALAMLLTSAAKIIEAFGE